MLIAVFLCAGFAEASAKTKRNTSSSNAPENKRYAAIVVDAASGEVLMAKYADSLRHPASLTKIMTLYMVFDAIEHGQLHMSDRIPISLHASKMSPSKLGLRAGSSIRVEDAIKALVTKSANDIAAAFAEKLAGSETRFATRMTRKARELGMSRTVYRNASGLPDVQQVTTARDMARLAMSLLRDFPQHYHYFGIRNFTYQGKSMTNHNRLLGQYRGLDGIKTGYINASGFNLVASAKQNGRRLIGVVFGGTSWRSRNDHMVSLLDEGFAELSTRSPAMREASITGTVPVPTPPPMRGNPAALAVTRAQEGDDSTDGAEYDTAYSQQSSQRLASMIDTAQAQSYAGVQQDHDETDDGTDSDSSVLSSPVPVPVPARRPIAYAAPTPAPPADRHRGGSTPASAARTVMQLRIPRSQVPDRIPESQIVRADDGQGQWSIQVGAFTSRAMTDQALRTAQSRLPAHLKAGQPLIVPQSTGHGIVFKARLYGYTPIQAAAACAQLNACIVVSPGS